MKKAAGVYGVVVGISIIGLWAMLLAQGQVPELITAPATIYFHITAELVMAVLMLISGLGLFLGKSWSQKLFTLSSGLVVYSVINSSGYYAQKGNSAMVFMFMALLAATVLMLAGLWANRKSIKK